MIFWVEGETPNFISDWFTSLWKGDVFIVGKDCHIVFFTNHFSILVNEFVDADEVSLEGGYDMLFL